MNEMKLFHGKPNWPRLFFVAGLLLYVPCVLWILDNLNGDSYSFLNVGLRHDFARVSGATAFILILTAVLVGGAKRSFEGRAKWVAGLALIFAAMVSYYTWAASSALCLPRDHVVPSFMKCKSQSIILYLPAF